MCACNRAGGMRQTRYGASTIVSRNAVSASVPQSAAPPNTLTGVQAMDPERLRIEQLRREAIRRSFGNIV